MRYMSLGGSDSIVAVRRVPMNVYFTCLIYVNVARNMKDQRQACIEYLETLNLNVLQ